MSPQALDILLSVKAALHDARAAGWMIVALLAVLVCVELARVVRGR